MSGADDSESGRPVARARWQKLLQRAVGVGVVALVVDLVVWNSSAATAVEVALMTAAFYWWGFRLIERRQR